MCIVKIYAVATLVAFLSLTASDALASIGKVVEVRQGATLTSGGSSKDMRVGMEINSGDTVSTNANGVVQLIFDDGTKIVVGPNARMKVDVSMMRGKQRAKNFAVKALGGSFRFISGNSDKGAYKIKTPNATMGIRGTSFDFWVDGNNQTAIVILSGQVKMCKPDGQCALVSGQCALVIAEGKGRIAAAADKEQAAHIIQLGFPFVRSQAALQKTFRTSTTGCSQRLIVISEDQSFAPQRVPPKPPEPPTPEPPAPPADAGFPGRSGDQGPSQGKGNDVSNGQTGTGTGKGRGAVTGVGGKDGGNGKGGPNGDANG